MLLMALLTLLRGCREGGPTIFAEVKNGKGVSLIVDLVLSAWRACGASHGVGGKPGPSS